MPDWQKIDYDVRRGVRKFIGEGDDPDTLLVRIQCDDFSIIERNKANQSEDFDRRSEMWHAASIPSSVMYEWLTRFGVNAWNPAHSDAVKKLLNSSDYRWCKVKNIIL